MVHHFHCLGTIKDIGPADDVQHRMPEIHHNRRQVTQQSVANPRRLETIVILVSLPR